MEISCLKNTNVSDAFETLIEIINREMVKNKSNVKDDRITVDNTKKVEKKKCSC